MKLKSRFRKQEEGLAELAEDIERFVTPLHKNDVIIYCAYKNQ